MKREISYCTTKNREMHKGATVSAEVISQRRREKAEWQVLLKEGCRKIWYFDISMMSEPSNYWQIVPECHGYKSSQAFEW